MAENLSIHQVFYHSSDYAMRHSWDMFERHITISPVLRRCQSLPVKYSAKDLTVMVVHLRSFHKARLDFWLVFPMSIMRFATKPIVFCVSNNKRLNYQKATGSGRHKSTKKRVNVCTLQVAGNHAKRAQIFVTHIIVSFLCP